MWYAIQDNTGRSVDILIKAGIPTLPVVIEQPRQITAVAFPDKNLDQALQLLGFSKDIYDIKKVTTDNHDVELIVLTEKPLKKILKSKEAQEKELKLKFLEQKEEIKQSYLKECEKLLPAKERLSTQETISSALEEYSNKLKKDLLERKRLSAEEVFGREYDIISNMDFVRKIRIKDGEIRIWTSPMTVKYGHARMHIGGKEFQIGLNGDVYIYPVTHWKVAREGRPCYGDLENEIPALVRKREFAVLTKMLMTFVISDEFNYHGKWGSMPEGSWEILRRKKSGLSLSKLANVGPVIRFFAKIFGIRSGAAANKNKIEFIQMCQRYARQELSSAEYRIESDKRNLQESFSHLVKRIQQDKMIREKLAKPEEKEEMLKKLSDDFERLVNLNDVARVEIANGQVRVLTKEIIIDTPDGPYSLGWYYITLGLDGSLEIKNSRPLQYDHPIVWQGQPVFDSQMMVAIAKYLGRMELANATQLIIDSLKSFNQEEALVSLDVWEGGSHD